MWREVWEGVGSHRCRGHRSGERGRGRLRRASLWTADSKLTFQSVALRKNLP